MPLSADLILTQHTSAEAVRARRLLGPATEKRATLGSNPKARETHELYERWGWQKVGIVPGGSGAYYREYVRFVLPLPTAGR